MLGVLLVSLRPYLDTDACANPLMLGCTVFSITKKRPLFIYLFVDYIKLCFNSTTIEHSWWMSLLWYGISLMSFSLSHDWCRCRASSEPWLMWHSHQLGWRFTSCKEVWSLWILLREWPSFGHFRTFEVSRSRAIYWHRYSPWRRSRRSVLSYWQVQRLSGWYCIYSFHFRFSSPRKMMLLPASWTDVKLIALLIFV